MGDGLLNGERAATSAGIESRIGLTEPGISMPVKSMLPISSSNSASSASSIGGSELARGDVFLAMPTITLNF